MLDKFIDFLLPRISLDDVDDETAEAYSYNRPYPNNICLAVSSSLFLCIVTVAVTAFVTEDFRTTLLLSIPTLIIAFSILFASKVPWFGGFSVILTLVDFGLTLFTLLLLADIHDIGRCIVAYYLVYLVFFVWILIMYRIKYKFFKEICFKRAGQIIKERNRTQFFSGIFSVVLVGALSRLLLGTFSVGVIAIGGAYFLCHLSAPLMAEYVVVARQYKPMRDKFKTGDSFGG